jgi:thiol:disulfide interchange protein
MNIESSTFQVVEPVEINRRMSNGETFVVNLVAAWCPDCTVRQKRYFDSFVQKMKAHEIEVLQVNVQLVRGDFVSDEHQQLTTQFGGHGYPRTVLIKHGEIVDNNNVEVITEEALSALAERFIQAIV